LRREDGTNELVGGAFVHIPSNPSARVLAAKSQSGGINDMSSIAEAKLKELEGEFAHKCLRGELTEKQAQEYSQRWEQLHVQARNAVRARQFAGSSDSSGYSGAPRAAELRAKGRAPSVVLDDTQTRELFTKARAAEATSVQCKTLGFSSGDSLLPAAPMPDAPPVTNAIFPDTLDAIGEG
jgi:hypothetical protein